MRDRNLLYLFLGLNVALAAAFVAYLFVSSNGQPKVVSTSFTNSAKTTQLQRVATTNIASAQSPATNRSPAVAQTNIVAVAPTNAAPAQPLFTEKKFSWKEVEAPEYLGYIKSLRAVGCP